MIEQFKDVVEQIWKWFLMAWAGAYAAFTYLFQPSAAWNAVWAMFLAAFVTKMVQMTYEEKGFWKMLRNRFSGKIALQKAAPKIVVYLFLMFAVARTGEIFSEGITNNFHFAVASFSFAVELLNSLTHLSSLPGVNISGVTEWVKKMLLPKDIPYDD